MLRKIRAFLIVLIAFLSISCGGSGVRCGPDWPMGCPLGLVCVIVNNQYECQRAYMLQYMLQDEASDLCSE